MTRHRILAVTALAVIVSVVNMPTRLIWNATASAPVGFYSVEPAKQIDVPELVVVMLPEPLTAFMAGRGYIAPGVPLLKRVVGLPGQRVCRTGSTITVDRVEMGEALERDSLDSRYFGPIPRSSIIGRAVPLWTDEEGNGGFEWRAPAH